MQIIPSCRRPWIIAGAAGCILLLLGLFLGGIGIGVVLWATRNPNKLESITDAATLSAKFKADPVGFQKRYEGKRLTVTGRVVGTESFAGSPMQVFVGASTSDSVAVQFLSPSDAPRAANSRRIAATGTVRILKNTPIPYRDKVDKSAEMDNSFPSGFIIEAADLDSRE